MSFKTRALYDPTCSPGKAGLQTCRSTCPPAHWCTSQDLNCRETQFRQFPCGSSFCSHSLCHHSHMGTTHRYACVSLETFQPNPSWQNRIQIERKQFCAEKNKTFCCNLKNHLRIREEYMWLYGHAMLEIQWWCQAGRWWAVMVY